MEELQGRQPHFFELEPSLSADEDSVFNQLSVASGGGSGNAPTGTDKPGTAISDPATAVERGGVRGRTNFDVLFDAAVVLSSATTSRHRAGATDTAPPGRNGTGVTGTAACTQQAREGDMEKDEAGVGELLSIMEEGVSGAEGVCALEWGWLSRDKAGRRSGKLYQEAAHAQVTPPVISVLSVSGMQRSLQLRNAEGKVLGTEPPRR